MDLSILSKEENYYQYSDSGQLYYRIPGELIQVECHCGRGGSIHMIPGKDVLVHNSRFEEMLWNAMPNLVLSDLEYPGGIIQYYFDKVILKINSILDRPKCTQCGNYLT